MTRDPDPALGSAQAARGNGCLPGVYLAVTGTPTQTADRDRGPRARPGQAALLPASARYAVTASGCQTAGPSRCWSRPGSSARTWASSGSGRLRGCRSSCSPTARCGSREAARAVADAARELGSFREVRAVAADAVQRRPVPVRPAGRRNWRTRRCAGRRGCAGRWRRWRTASGRRRKETCADLISGGRTAGPDVQCAAVRRPRTFLAVAGRVVAGRRGWRRRWNPASGTCRRRTGSGRCAGTPRMSAQRDHRAARHPASDQDRAGPDRRGHPGCAGVRARSATPGHTDAPSGAGRSPAAG